MGTHFGYFTCFAAKMAPECDVYGFEMDPCVFELLERNIRLNSLKNMEAYNYAVSDKNDLIKIAQNEEPSPMRSMVECNTSNAGVKIKSITLDSFFEGKQAPELLKIDVEGAELLVLKGMKKILTDSNPEMFIELHGNKLAQFNTNSLEVLSFLIRRGYEVYEIINHRGGGTTTNTNMKRLSESSLIEYNTMIYVYKRT